MRYQSLPYADVHRFCVKIFSGYGFKQDECEVITDVLLCSDLFGIESHGIQRLIRYHGELSEGFAKVAAQPAVIHETPVSAVIDADKSMGQIVSVRAMKLAIEKAKSTGIGMVSVRNSNHYGIAGYYAEMAVKEDLMGICMTNSEALAVPTFGKRAMLGTNPIALGFPADPVDFLFDAATTVVTRGKVEVYNKNEKPLPDGWAVDADGKPSRNASEIISNIINKLGGGIAPLGGSEELHGSHKGYGLGIIVDIFTGILSTGVTSNHVNATEGHNDTAHFFMAVDYNLFGDKSAIKEHFSKFLQELRDSPKADGKDRIFTHGEKESESKKQKMADGIPINDKTLAEMKMIAESQGVKFDEYFTLA